MTWLSYYNEKFSLSLEMWRSKKRPKNVKFSSKMRTRVHHVTNDAAGLQPVRVPCKHDFPAFSVRLSLSPWKSEQIYVALTRRTAYLRTIITTRITCEEGLDPDCPLLRLLSLVFLPFDTLAESLSARGAFSVGTEHANRERDIRWKDTMITIILHERASF